jgi:phosphatidylglycerophosphate synthase
MPRDFLRDAAFLLAGSGSLSGILAVSGDAPLPVAVTAALAGMIMPGAAITSVARRHRRFYGPADLISLVRAVLGGGVATLTVLAVFTGDVRPWQIFALATTALVLDGVDGAVARQTGTVSGAGARLDMEIDAALAAVLIVPVGIVVGWWALPLGYLRYAFSLATRIRPSLRRPLPPSRIRQAIGTAQGVVLCAALVPVLPLALRGGLVILMLMVVLASFTRDIAMMEQAGTVR